jgi:hypothetical protein
MGVVGQRPDVGSDAFGKQGEHGGIDRVRLGQPTDCFGKVPHLTRIHHRDRHMGDRQGGYRCGFIPAGRFDNHECRR